MHPYSAADFNSSPLLVFYEVTRACNLLCVHCRADAQRQAHPEQLTTDQSLSLIRQLKQYPRPPLLVLTGGDPLKREDLFDLISAARAQGLEVALSPSATPLVTPQALTKLRKSGLHRLALSLDGADAATHDGFRRVPGSFERTLDIIGQARSDDLQIQINTTITRHNVDQIESIANLIAELDIAMWSVFFLIPTGRALANQCIQPDQYEEAFEDLWVQSLSQPYAIKTTEAPQYRRFVTVKGGNPPQASGRLIGTNDGKGVLFVSHIGEIYPSGFLPIECGRFPRDSVVDVYQNNPLMRRLRDPDALSGKCGSCEFRRICGGSRARAFALTGNPLAAEPHCTYEPKACAEAKANLKGNSC
jgi:AdoMet-dependent heme synthase